MSSTTAESESNCVCSKCELEWDARTIRLFKYVISIQCIWPRPFCTYNNNNNYYINTIITFLVSVTLHFAHIVLFTHPPIHFISFTVFHIFVFRFVSHFFSHILTIYSICFFLKKNLLNCYWRWFLKMRARSSFPLCEFYEYCNAVAAVIIILFFSFCLLIIFI